MNEPRPVSFRERGESEPGFTTTFTGGPNCGESFRHVLATMSDGTEEWMFASDSRPGLFRRRFVPWDFKHPDIV